MHILHLKIIAKNKFPRNLLILANSVNYIIYQLLYTISFEYCNKLSKIFQKEIYIFKNWFTLHILIFKGCF